MESIMKQMELMDLKEDWVASYGWMEPIVEWNETKWSEWNPCGSREKANQSLLFFCEEKRVDCRLAGSAMAGMNGKKKLMKLIDDWSERQPGPLAASAPQLSSSIKWKLKKFSFLWIAEGVDCAIASISAQSTIQSILLALKENWWLLMASIPMFTIKRYYNSTW